MDTTGVGSLPGSAAVDTGWAATILLLPDELSNATDEQLMALTNKGNTQAVLELEKRDTARAARRKESLDQSLTVSGALDRPGLVELGHPDAERAAKLPESPDQIQTATAATLDAPGVLGLEEPDAAQAAKLLASADETVFAAAEEAVGNIVDKFA